MSRLVPPTGVGLAAAGLAGVLLSLPSLAYADSGAPADPTPTSTAAAAPVSTPSPSREATPSVETSSSAVPSAEPTPEASSSGSASATPAEPDQSSSPSDEGADGTRGDSGVQGDSGSQDDSRPVSAAQDAVQAPGAEAAAEQQAQAEGPEQAGITLTKTASPTRVSKIGQVVTYRFVATNTGSVELSNVAISDELEGLSTLSCDQSSASATLAPTQALHCSATLTVTQAVLDFGDIDNFATVFGEYDIEGQGDYVGANAAAHVTVVQQPSIALSASVAPTGRADRGDRLRYSATATNTGNVTLTAARITSNLDALDLTCKPAARATLAPGASISCAGSYRVSRADARQGGVSATLTARAEQPYGDSSAIGDDVADSSTLRVAVTKPASNRSDETGSADSLSSELADSGSPEGSLPVGLLGAVLAASGIGLIRRGRHR